VADTTASPVVRQQAAARLLFHRPMASRLVSPTRPLTEALSSRVASLRSVFIRGLTRASFAEVCQAVQALCPSLATPPYEGGPPSRLLGLSFAGPITEFVVATQEDADALAVAFVAHRGPRSVCKYFDPLLPLREADRSDPEALGRARLAYISRRARDISRTNNIVLGTYLLRQCGSGAASHPSDIQEALDLAVRGRAPRSTPSRVEEGGTA
jgi:hypothetical protein